MGAALTSLRAYLPRGRTLPAAQFERRHLVLTRLLWAHVLGLPIVGALYGYPWWHCLFEGSIVAVWAVAAQARPGGRRLQAMVTAGGLMTCSAVLVHITGGLIEAHFHFFVLVTVLSLYEDWAVYGVAVGYVLLHHGMGALFGMHIYDHGGNPWLWAGVHSGYIVALCIANVVVWRSSEQARLELQDAHAELERRATDLARSNRELQEFTAVASHDLSEPLRMVTGYLRLLERRTAKRLTADEQQFIAYATDGAERMRGLIDDLLTYSRVERDTFAPAAVDLGQVAETTLRGLQAAIAEADATITTDPLPTVSGDAGQLGQLLQNLLANAIKFRRPGVAPVVAVTAVEAGDEWTVTVADNGIGIDPDHAERVFQMFQRLHSRDQYEGTGIGLAICRRIVERHGGRLWVQANRDGGTSMRFTLPAAVAGAPRSAPSLVLTDDVGEGPLPDPAGRDVAGT